jgi:type VI secretion system protein VasG
MPDSYPVFSPLLVEWLRDGWLLASAEMQQTELRGGTLLALLQSAHRYVPPAAARLLTGSTVTGCAGFCRLDARVGGVGDAKREKSVPAVHSEDSVLARFAKNMTEDARNGKLDPVLCRDNEIDLMIDILCRRRKNNPVVVGEAGVGKSALIEGWRCVLSQVRYRTSCAIPKL